MSTPFEDFPLVPADLKAKSQWLIWRFESSKNGGTPGKIPYRSDGQGHAKSNDSSTWSTFEDAIDALNNGEKYSGIGFAFAKGDGLAGVDVDVPWDDPIAIEVTEHFVGTYCERSPSNKLRIFCKGKVRRCGKGSVDHRIEAYDCTSPRYLTVTGNHIEKTSLEVTEQQPALDWLHEKYFKRPAANGADSEALDVQNIIDGLRKKTDNEPGNLNASFTKLIGHWVGRGLKDDDIRIYAELIAHRINETAQWVWEEWAPIIQWKRRKSVEDWPDPGTLPNGLPPVEPFDPLLLPQALRPWVRDISERMQCPPDFVAAAALVALGSVIGRRCGLRPKRYDDWTVVPNLWGAGIGRPGLLKSPAIGAAMRPLKRLEAKACEAHEEAARSYKNMKKTAELKRKAAEEMAKSDLKKGLASEEICARLEALNDGNDEAPVCARYITNDSTVEALGKLLAENPAGMLVLRDEIIGWLRSFEKEGREGDRSFFLEAWNGDDSYIYDRIGRGTVRVKSCCVSVFGGIPPGPLMTYLTRFAFDGAGDDGLLQRMQVIVWPDVGLQWANVDRYPDTECNTRAFRVFERLATLTADLVEADHDRLDHDAIPFLRFEDTAQEAFNDWRTELEHTLRKNNYPPAWEAYLSKLRSLIPSIALICHLANGEVGPVSYIAFLRAEAWGEYLKSHAARVYDGLLRPDQSVARALAAKIINGALTSGFTIKDVYHQGWSGLTDRAAVVAAVDVLCDLDWLRAERRETRGRTATGYLINPKLQIQRGDPA